jgi:hypothetical protein
MIAGIVCLIWVAIWIGGLIGYWIGHDEAMIERDVEDCLKTMDRIEAKARSSRITGPASQGGEGAG